MLELEGRQRRKTDAKWREREATETHEDNLNPNLDGASVLKEKPVPFIKELNTHLAQKWKWRKIHRTEEYL